MAWVVDAGRIHKNELIFLSRENPQLTFARGLRLGRNRRDLLTEQSIEQS